MEFINQLVLQFKTIYSKMTTPQKVSFLLILASIGICLVVVFLWSSKPDYVVLFSDLSTEDAAKVHAKLTELKVPYEVTGTTIKVPSQYVYETRLLLANEGLPKGAHIGYEIFDKTSMGQTDYIQRLNFQRALEGELSRTISSLEAVDFARVHLVIPRPTIFTDKEEKVSASIVVTTSRTTSLSKKNVLAVTHLVASSVEGLEPADVTIIDSSGNLLSSVMESNVAVGLTNSQLEVQQNIERYMENKVSTLLTGVLGPGKAIVRVNAQIDFSQTEKKKELFNPESQVARSENRIEETTSSEGDNGSTVEKTITNFEINKTVEHIIGATGTTHRLSLAVVIDGTYKYEDEEKKEKVYVARTEEEKESIKKLVISSIGIDEKRGDEIEVINIPFDTSYLEEQRLHLEDIRRRETIGGLVQQWPWLVVVLVFVALFILLQRIISQASLTRVAIRGPSGRGRAYAPRGGKFEAGFYDSMREKEDYESEKEAADFEAERRAREKMEEEVVHLAAASPDAVAKIIKEWLSEE